MEQKNLRLEDQWDIVFDEIYQMHLGIDYEPTTVPKPNSAPKPTPKPTKKKIATKRKVALAKVEPPPKLMRQQGYYKDPVFP